MSFNFDLVIKNGIVVTASDETACDIGVIGGKIAILGVGLPVPEGCTVIDAEGGFVTVRPLQSQVERPKALTSCVLPQPGGVDSHVHVAQSASKAAGARSSDDWTTATRSALGGALSCLPLTQLAMLIIRAQAERRPLSRLRSRTGASRCFRRW